MSKWINQFLENEIVNRSDKSDRFDLGVNLSGLSGRPQGHLDEKKVENNLNMRGDKSDRFTPKSNLSLLSLRSRGLLDKNLEKVENNPSKGGDKSARFKFELNMSPLSLRSQGLFPETEKNRPTNALTDLTRGHQSAVSVPPEGLFPLDRNSLLYDFEERLAIAEYDGDQTPLHAHHIVYLDAFISVLTTLAATGPQRDWLDRRIQTSLAWIEAQGFKSIN